MAEETLKILATKSDASTKRTVTLTFEGDNLAHALDDRAHDVKEAFNVFSGAVRMLKHGYKFDDDTASERIESLERALEILNNDVQPIIKAALSK